MRLQITITSMRSAPAPDFPSHLFAGAGSDRATFRVTRGAAPSREAISVLLEDAIADVCVTNYDQVMGQGSFVVVDGAAPAPGTTIELDDDAVADSVDLSDGTPPSSGAPIHRPTIEQFYDMLDQHDWFFGYSDDSRVYRNGSDDLERLKAIAVSVGDNYAALLAAFQRHHFSGEPWSTPKWDKPPRPVSGVVNIPTAPAPASTGPSQQQDGRLPVVQRHVQRDDDLGEFAAYQRHCISNLVAAALAWRNARRAFMGAAAVSHKPRVRSQFFWMLGWRRGQSDAAEQVEAAQSLGFADVQLEQALGQLMDAGFDVDAHRSRP
ncbi:hypothetical protein [Burkholderia sp. AU45388]|uniref:hypothetical protein n=1 Tax=Burkholderia sp. AU45388 TaxID=3059206 RepID=UPI0026570000|nr:hypothetical protein [Burkholderia sp. AU45388]MDN7430798.1 hypothetical protein [Burkholderia sp. AU45388]